MDHTRILIIGGGTGTLAARRLALKTRGLPVEITLINGSDHFTERVRLHQLATRQKLEALPMTRLLAGRDVRFQQGWVTRIEPSSRTVTVKIGESLQEFGYDYLVYALGSFVDTSRVPGGAANTMALSSEDAALRLAEALPRVAEAGGRVVVCGAGLTGIELSTEVAETYPALDVTLITRGRFGANISPRGVAYLRRALDRLDIDLLEDTPITRIEPGRVVCQDGSIPFDLCLWAGGFSVPPLAREAGLAVNARGQIVVDDHLHSVSHPEVLAIGDAADLSQAIPTPIRMAGATALPMAGYAGDEIAAQLRARPHAPYEFAYGGRCISLGRHDALFQAVDADDRPLGLILTGRVGAWVKETICRFGPWQVRNDHLMYYPRRPFGEKRAGARRLAAWAQTR